MQKGSQARPTTDKVRSSIFSILHDVEGRTILDGFAGSGAIGIEAFSRGASYIDFVDIDISNILLNIDLIKNGSFEVYKGDFLKIAQSLLKKYDIIFLDPPYGKYEPAEILKICSNLLTETGLIVYEEYFKTDFSSAKLTEISLIKEKRYGDTMLRIYSRNK